MSASLSRQRWKMLLLTMFCYLFFYTGRHNFGWATKQLAQDLHISFENIGWISFAMLIGYAAGQLVNGNLADRYSPKHMITIGGLLSVLANILLSFSSSFTAILILWTLNGYFQSMAWAAGSKIISNWWGSFNRGLAYGMYTMAAGASSILTYALSIALVHQGWRNIFRLPVLLLAIAAIIFFIFVRNKPSDIGLYDPQDQPQSDEELEPQTKIPASQANIQTPQASIAAPLANILTPQVNIAVPEANIPTPQINIAAPQANIPDSEPQNPGWRISYAKAFANKKFLIVCLSIGFQSMARYGLIFWVPLYFLGKESSNAMEIWVTLLLPIGMSIGALSFGFISDRLFQSDRIRSITLGMGCCCIISILLYCFHMQSSILISLFVFGAGFFSYGPQANFWALAPELLGRTYVGTATGIMNMCAYLFAALGEPLMGRLIDMTGSKSVIFITVAVIALLSMITILLTHLIRPTKNALNTLNMTL